METVQSKDGTTIAFERSGDGRPLILVRGANATAQMLDGPTHRADPSLLAPLLEAFFLGQG